MTRAGMWLLCAAAGLGLGAADAARGQAPDPPAPPQAGAAANPQRADDEAAIRSLDAAFVKAFNAADLDALLALFTDDAQVVDEHGQAVTGAEAIRGRFAQAFENHPGAALSIEVTSLRFAGADTAVERGTATVTPPEGAGAPESSPFTVVYVRRDGAWKQALIEDHAPPPAEEPPTNEERLRPVAWLLGDWVNESADSVVLTHCQWDEGKNFLIQQFTVRAVGRPVLKGTHRIGWDPVRKQVRSWMFDSEGGFGEAFWSRGAEGRWVIRAHGSRRDGRTAEATRIVTVLDDHRIRWESVDRAVGGEALPDIDAFVMVRKPPAPGAAPPPGTTEKPR